MRLTKIIALIICAALLLSACGREIEPPQVVSEPVVTDAPPVKPAYPVSVGNETFEASPAGVASLSPALTEILFDLGVGDRLIAVSDYCDYPSAVTGMPKTGSPANPDISAIAAFKPELLLTMSPIASADTISLKQEHGVRVLEISRPKSYAELCDVYLNLAMIFYGAVDYSEIAWNALDVLDSQMSAASDLGILRSFVIVEAKSPEGLMLSHGDTLASDMLSVFGHNLWEDSDRFTATDDELFVLAPDIVFYAQGLRESDIEKVFPYSQLIEIDFERFERPTVRLAETIAYCADRLKR